MTVIYSERNLEVMRKLMQSYPQVREGKMFGYPAFFAGRHLVACVYGEGVGLKLPAEDAEAQLKRQHVVPFQPSGRPRMRCWVQINRSRPADYRHDVATFEKAIALATCD